jgi:hypothetical protein
MEGGCEFYADFMAWIVVCMTTMMMKDLVEMYGSFVDQVEIVRGGIAGHLLTVLPLGGTAALSWQYYRCTFPPSYTLEPSLQTYLFTLYACCCLNLPFFK